MTENQYDWNIAGRDDELCPNSWTTAMIHEKLCSKAIHLTMTGVTFRIKKQMQLKTKKQREQMCKNLNRYSARQCCRSETALAAAAISTTVGALYKAREDERARAWQINEGYIQGW